jgi:hypothetical protein
MNQPAHDEKHSIDLAVFKKDATKPDGHAILTAWRQR